MKAVNLDEEITVLRMQKRKNEKEEMKNEGRKPTSLPHKWHKYLVSKKCWGILNQLIF